MFLWGLNPTLSTVPTPYPQPPAPNRNRNTKPEAAGALIHDKSCYVVWREAVASDGGKMTTAAALN